MVLLGREKIGLTACFQVSADVERGCITISRAANGHAAAFHSYDFSKPPSDSWRLSWLGCQFSGGSRTTPSSGLFPSD